MKRKKYLSKTREKFYKQDPEENTFGAYNCVSGIYKVKKYKIIEIQDPECIDTPKKIIVTANWKPGEEVKVKIKGKDEYRNEQEEFLEELEFNFDFTPLLENISSAGLNLDDDKPYDYKFDVFLGSFQYRDIKIKNLTTPISWQYIEKTTDVVGINNLENENKIIYNSKILPRLKNNGSQSNEEGNIVYVLKGSNKDLYHDLYPGCRIVEIESDNLRDAFSNEWVGSIYFLSLNSLRNSLGITMANSVPVPGYYFFHTIRLEAPRKDSNGNPLGYDTPYQVIGIGHWTPLEDKNNFSIIEFNKNQTMEVRLNPLMNNVAVIKGLSPTFPRVKNFTSFYSIARSSFIKINDVSFDDYSRSYIINWEAVLINEKVEEVQ